MKLVFATNNPNKLSEVKLMLSDKIEVVSLKEIGFYDDIPEPFNTLEENSLTKAQTIYEQYGLNCFAEDTGLEVEALDGKPGVLSARYAGPEKLADKNMDKILFELQGSSNRKARFRTVATLIINGKVHQFEGIVEGKITEEKTGSMGFGYDPIFKADGYNITFAEMDKTEKNIISHRGKAINKLVDFLNNQCI